MAPELITVGQSAPDLSLSATIGPSPLALSALRGKTLVLAFFPLAFTDT